MAWEHTCDHEGPDPYEVISGFRQLPLYRCQRCEFKKPDVDTRYVFDRATGFHEEKLYCEHCWEIVRAQ